MKENPFQSPEVEETVLSDKKQNPKTLSRYKSIYSYTFNVSNLCLIIAVLIFLVLPILDGSKTNNQTVSNLLVVAVLLASVSGITNIIGVITGSILYKSKQIGLRGILYHTVLFLIPIVILPLLTLKLLTN